MYGMYIVKREGLLEYGRREGRMRTVDAVAFYDERRRKKTMEQRKSVLVVVCLKRGYTFFSSQLDSTSQPNVSVLHRF